MGKSVATPASTAGVRSTPHKYGEAPPGPPPAPSRANLILAVNMPPLSQSRPKRAAADATAEKILSSLKEERAAPGERDTSVTATAQPAKRQRRAVPSSAVKVEKAQTQVAAAAGSQSTADAAAPKSAAKAAPPKATTPIVHLRSIKRQLSVDEASITVVQLAKDQAEQTRKMTEAEKAVRAAKKALKDAEAAKEAVQASINTLAEKMAVAKRDQRTDIERVMEVIERPPSYGNSMLAEAFDDLLTLQADTAKIESAAQKFVANKHVFRHKTPVLDLLIRKTQPRLLAATSIILGSFDASDFERVRISLGVDECRMLVDAAVLVAPTSPAVAEPLVEELIRRGKQPATKVAGHTLIETCPIHKFVHPAWEKMRHVPQLAASAARLVSAMRVELEASVCKPIPAAPDYAMPEEAARIGNRDVNLRDFLLSNQTALTINASKAGRMAVHRLIDGLGLSGKLSHESEGFGHARALVVRKRAVTTPQDIAHTSDLQAAHRKLLATLPQANVALVVD